MVLLKRLVQITCCIVGGFVLRDKNLCASITYAVTVDEEMQLIKDLENERMTFRAIMALDKDRNFELRGFIQSQVRDPWFTKPIENTCRFSFDFLNESDELVGKFSKEYAVKNGRNQLVKVNLKEKLGKKGVGNTDASYLTVGPEKVSKITLTFTCQPQGTKKLFDWYAPGSMILMVGLFILFLIGVIVVVGVFL